MAVQRRTGPGFRAVVQSSLVAVLVLATLVALPTAAQAAINISRAELQSGSLRVEGSGARPGAALTVTGVTPAPAATADSGGAYRIQASGVSSATCKVSVSDGATTAQANLSGCTPTAPPPPPPSSPPPPPPSSPPPPPPPGTPPPPAAANNGMFAYTISNFPGGVATAFPNGTGAKNVTGPFASEPAWSPNGSKLAFSQTVAVRCQCVAGAFDARAAITSRIETSNADGSGVFNVTTGDPVERFPAFGDFHPVWSPNGSQLAFASTRTGLNLDIWVVNADGTGRHNVTNTPNAWEDFPSWSSTGKILFTRATTEGNLSAGISDLWVMNPDGTGRAQLPGPGFDSDGKWSPNASRITFQNRGPSTSQECAPGTDALTCDFDVYTMNADGSGRSQLTTNSARDDNPSWSPDGKKIVFTRRFSADSTGGDGIYVMNADGSAQTRENGDPAFDYLGGNLAAWADVVWQNKALPPVALVHFAIPEYSPQDDFIVGPEVASTTGRLDLTGPAPAGGITVSLSSNSSAAAVPPSVTVPAGQDVATFPITFSPPAAPSALVTLTAASGTVSISRRFTVERAPTRVTHLRALPASLPGGSTLVQIDLDGNAPPAGLTVQVTTGPHLSAPATAFVQWGASGTTVNVTADSVTAPQSTFVKATFNGLGASTLVGLVPAGGPVVSSLTVTPSALQGGTSATGRVTLSAAAPAGGALVPLNTAALGPASFPESVTVPAGATSTTFTITTSTVTSAVDVFMDASYGGNTQFFKFPVTPNAPTPVDTVAIQRALWSDANRSLRVEATSTNPSATLKVFSNSDGALIGTLTNNGGGRYSGTFNFAHNPVRIEVRSNFGGTATRATTV